jgi:anaerobic ribonucleoside-triphosphate reductase activating protein
VYPLNYSGYDILLKEVPDEISLGINLCGCPLRCKGCHSPELRDPNFGECLSEETFKQLIDKYKMFISCVLFFGGDWDESWLLKSLKYVKNNGLKTCLYTGMEHVSDDIYLNLNYLKTGPFFSKKGGLKDPNSNQKMINTITLEKINYKFWEKK